MATKSKKQSPPARDIDLEQRFLRAVGKLRSAQGQAKISRAVAEVRACARLGHSGAMFEMGAMYRLGQGVRRNRVLALMWMLRAASGGDTDAEIQCVLIQGELRPDQIERAKRWAGGRTCSSPITGCAKNIHIDS